MGNEVIVDEFELEEDISFGKRGPNRFYQLKKRSFTTTEAIYDNAVLIQKILDMLCSDQLLVLHVKTNLEIVEIVSSDYSKELAIERESIIDEVFRELDQEA